MNISLKQYVHTSWTSIYDLFYSIHENYQQLINILETKVSEWENRISQLSDIIKNLGLQRDKVYAHDDLNNEIDNIISLEDISKLLIIFSLFKTGFA